MKNLKKIFLFTAIAGIFYACDDATEIIQKGELPESIVYETVEDMNQVLVNVYSNVTNKSIIGFTSIFTDETAIGESNGGQNLEDYRFNIFPTNSFAQNIWASNYAAIAAANRLIEGSENVIVEEGSAEEAEKNRILAEARAIRAFAHFQLLTFFSEDLTDNNGLGVIIADYVPVAPYTDQLPRSTNSEVFAFIESDLDYAVENLQGGNSYLYITPNFITALRARMELYRGNHTQAEIFANQLISNPGYSLASSAQAYLAIWTDQNPQENIFALARPFGQAAIADLWFFNNATLAGGPFLEMSRSLFNKLTEVPGDFRATAFVHPSSIIAPDYQTVPDYRNSDVLVIGKYRGITGAPLNNDLKIFRIVEMHFIVAEARAAAGDFAGVAAALQTIRNARFASAAQVPVRASAQEAWADILDERRLELCYEGHRYIDLKRLGTLANRTVDRYVRDCEPYNACSISVEDYRFTLPIPINELNGNFVIREQQNPGY